MALLRLGSYVAAIGLVLSLRLEGNQYYYNRFITKLLRINEKRVVTVHTLKFFYLFKFRNIDRGIIRLCNTRSHVDTYVNYWHSSQVLNFFLNKFMMIYLDDVWCIVEVKMSI